jgi:cytochrome b involved in lipid metabolism
MKKYTTISLFIFWAITVAVITAGLITSNNSQLATGPNIETTSNPPNNSSSPTKNPVNKTTGLTLTKTELAKHNSSSSCWLLISGKIYDVTSYLNQHPGNASAILPTCGTDATFAYNTQGPTSRPHSHSSNARAMLDAYFLGNLNQK